LRSVQRWCQLVRQGREDLHDGDHLGRPTLDFIDSQIISLLEPEPFHSVYSLAEAIGFHIRRYFDTCMILLEWKIFIFVGSHTGWQRIYGENESQFVRRCSLS
jgi:hypothetical protein